MDQPIDSVVSLPPRASDLLATGLGTTTGMWIVGYIAYMPLLQKYMPLVIVFVALVGVMFLGGYIFGRDSNRTWRIAWLPPLITALVNLPVFASVLKGESHDVLEVALPIFFGVTMLVMLIGFAAGKARRRDPSGAHWRLRLALVPVAATGLAVSAGGLLTGLDAGFFVRDWPTTKNADMFLFPVFKMTGGIYYEHAHRLAGTLVGFTALVTMIWTWIVDRRLWVALFTTLALLMVVAQGIAGGLWLETASLPYILFHGTFGQIILATFVVIAAMHAPSWRNKTLAMSTPAASTDHVLTVLLLLAFIVQTLLGVYISKRPEGPLLMHVSFAVVVVALVVAVAFRGLAIHGKRLPPLKRVSNGLLHGVTLQVLLGFAALAVRRHTHGSHFVSGVPTLASFFDATITTMHQSLGAFLLAFAALAVAWNFRLLRHSDRG